MTRKKQNKVSRSKKIRSISRHLSDREAEQGSHSPMLFRIYTKTGDSGDTSLACGSRIPKDDLKIEAYGSLDELSSLLGIIGAKLSGASAEASPWVADVVHHLEWVQNNLFNLSTMIATINLPKGNMPALEQKDIDALESHIDSLERDLPELRNFILPGGSEVVSFFHLARTVCRRSERVCTTLSREEKMSPLIVPFLNRLSDDLFVLARWVGYARGEEEKLWLGRNQ